MADVPAVAHGLAHGHTAGDSALPLLSVQHIPTTSSTFFSTDSTCSTSVRRCSASPTSRRVSDRVRVDVPPPAWRPLRTDQLFRLRSPGASSSTCATELERRLLENGTVDCEQLRAHFLAEGKLERAHVRALITRAATLFRAEPNLLSLSGPTAVFGDIHGQFFDLDHVLTGLAMPSASCGWLFLGDLVDRGLFSVEVTLYVFALKIAYPQYVHLLRGNHECRLLTSRFTFREECFRKYGEEVYDAFMNAFDTLPLAATVETQDGVYFCSHGGLSPDLPKLTDFACVDRFCEIPIKGALCDLVWSDPLEDETALDLDEKDIEEWRAVDFVENPTRGCGQVFGYAAVDAFLRENNLLMLIRAHEVQRQGYLEHKMTTDRTMVLTVFTAAHYCDMYHNKGAILHLKEVGYELQQFENVPHPYVLPKCIDGLSYTISYITEQLADLLVGLTKYCDALDDEDLHLHYAGMNHRLGTELRQPSTPPLASEDVYALLSPRSSETLRRKVSAISRMRMMFRLLRLKRQQELEDDVEKPDQSFDYVREHDKANEGLSNPEFTLHTLDSEKQEIRRMVRSPWLGTDSGDSSPTNSRPGSPAVPSLAEVGSPRAISSLPSSQPSSVPGSPRTSVPRLKLLQSNEL